jgi:hypothetical protein
MRSTGLRRWYINITITILDIIHSSVFYLNTWWIILVPHRKHITSPLRTQQVNAIYGFVATVYCYNYRNSGHYPSSCLLFKTHERSCSYLTGNILRLLYEFNGLVWSVGLWRYINIFVEILDVIRYLVFYLKQEVPERERLALSTGPNCIRTNWIWRQNPVSEMLCCE